MILKFDEHDYVNVDEIVALRWLPSGNKGCVVFNGDRIMVNRNHFDRIEEAFLWLHKTSLYGPEYKRIKLVQIKGEE